MLSRYMQNRIRRNHVLAFILSIIVVLSIGCGIIKEKKASEPTNITVEESGTKKKDTMTAKETEIESEISTESQITTVNLLAVGDNLIHSGLYKSGMNKNGAWNYDHLYQYVKEDIAAADLAVVNQETILINDHEKLGGYPNFGTPVEIADALVNAGFDVILGASNHTMDKGLKGITDTMTYWKTNYPDITLLGLHESQEDADTIKVVECNGIKIAMLNYTYGMNGYTLPAEQPYLVDILDKEKVAADIAKAKEISDMVVFFGHMGKEYVYEPIELSKQWMEFLLEQGVDIAINSHPHVLEPYTMMTGKDGHQMLAYYSMGNFISTQDKVPRLLGGMAKITIEKETKGEESTIRIKDYTMEPLISHWNHSTKDYAVYKLADYTDEMAAKHSIRKVDKDEEFTVKHMQSLFDEIMNIKVTPVAEKLPSGPAVK